MKAFIIIVILLIAALWLGLLFHQDSGQVLIHYGTWSIETTLWVAIVAILLGFIIFYLLLRFIFQTQLWPHRLLLWGRKRKSHKMLELTRQGIDELIAAKWRLAEQHLDKAASLSPLPLVNYLGAAYAASQQTGGVERCNQYLQQIGQKGLVVGVNLRLLEAQLHLANKEWAQVQSDLAYLYQQNPKHPQVICLLAEVYKHQHNWLALQPLLAQLHKQQLLPAAELNYLDEHCGRALLAYAAEEQNADALILAWRQIPPPQQTNLLVDYVRHLVRLQQDQQVLILIERFLKQHWNVDLLRIYAWVNCKDVNKQLAQAESWLNKHPHSPELFACLGILSMRCQFWGKAKEYLTTALHLQPTAANHHALAKVYEAINEPELALQHYREGLELAQ